MKHVTSHVRVFLTAFIIICVGSFCVSDELRALKEAPAPDPSVVNGTADTKFSREWWKIQNKNFTQALSENNTEVVISIARESVDGWRYNAPATYIILVKSVDYLQREPGDHLNDLILLMDARAEAAQYVLAVNDETRDATAVEVLCVPYEQSMVYKTAGQDVLALQELERFYREGRAERERLKNAPHVVAADCPLEEKTVLAMLVEAHLALALAEGSAVDAVQQHFRAAFDYTGELMEHADAKDVFWWGDGKIADHFGGNPIWTFSNLTLWLAREMHFSPSDYITLAVETVGRLTEPEPFSLNDAILGLQYLETEGASEAQQWDFLELYQEYFGGWPDGKNSFEYQSHALSRLKFAILHKNRANAEAVIAELSTVMFSDPDLQNLYNELQFAFQDTILSPPPKLPMASVIDGMVKALQADASSNQLQEGKDATILERIVSIARNNPVSVALLGVTLVCFITLIAMRVRRMAGKE